MTAESRRSFRRIGPGGGGGQLRPLISPHDPDALFITCDMTGWYQSRDAGRSWRNINLKGVVRSAAFDPTDPAVIYAGNSGLYRSTDTGLTWRLIWPDPEKVTAEVQRHDHADHRYESSDNWPGGMILGIAVDPANAARLYVAVLTDPRDRGELAFFTSPDGGKNFVPVAAVSHPRLKNDIGDNHAVRLMHVDPDSDRDDRRVYVFTPVGLYRLSMREAMCDRMSMPPGTDTILHAAAGRDLATGSAVFYVTTPTKWKDASTLIGGVFRSDDGGHTWRQMLSGMLDGLHAPGQAPPPSFTCIACGANDPSVAYVECRDHRERSDTDAVYGHPGGVFKTADGGRSWQWAYRASWDERPLNVTTDGWLSHWLGPGWGGAAIQIATAPSDPEVCWRVTAMTSQRTTDGGNSWQETYCSWRPDGSVTTNGMDVTTCYGVHHDPHVRGRMFISYTDISLFRSEDGGEGWWLDKGGIPNDWRNTCYWMVLDPAVRDRMWSVWSGCHDLPRPKMFPGDWSRRRGGVAFSGDGGRSWHPTTSGMPDHAVPTHIILDPASPIGMRTLYVASFNDGVFRSDNDGRSWKLCNNGLDAYKLYAWRLAMAGDGALYLCVARGGDEENYIDGAVYRSADRGESWTRLAMPERTNAPNDLAVDPRNPKRLYLACWPRTVDRKPVGGGLWASGDGGATWENVLDQKLHAYAVTIEPANPDRLYVGGFNSSVFRSDDRGASWRRLGGYNFKWGHRVSPDPLDPEMIYVTTFGGSVFHGPADGTGADFEDIVPRGK